MDAAHADGEELLAAAHLLQPFYPILLNGAAVGDVVIWSTLLDVPLSHVIAQQGLAVAGADDDAEGVGHLLVASDGEEARRHIVHGGPERVGPQAEHQLEQPLVGLRPHVVLRPSAQAPVLVVDEQAAIGHAGGVLVAERVGQRDGLEATMWPHVAPPHPRRHLGHAAQLQDAVGGATGVVPFYHHLTVLHADAEAVVVALALHDANAGVLGLHGLVGRHQLHVVDEHLQGLLHHRGHPALHLIGDGGVAVVPHELAAIGRCPIAGRHGKRAEGDDGGEEEALHGWC